MLTLEMTKTVKLPGYLPQRIVLVKLAESSYVTWIETDSPDGCTPHHLGHYHHDLDEAFNDYAKRADRLLDDEAANKRLNSKAELAERRKRAMSNALATVLNSDSARGNCDTKALEQALAAVNNNNERDLRRAVSVMLLDGKTSSLMMERSPSFFYCLVNAYVCTANDHISELEHGEG